MNLYVHFTLIMDIIDYIHVYGIGNCSREPRKSIGFWAVRVRNNSAEQSQVNGSRSMVFLLC